MARCSNCGAELLDTARFCHQCGQPTGLAPDEQTTKAKTIALSSDQEGQTVFLPDDPANDDEEATTLLQEIDEGDGSTTAVSDDWPGSPNAPSLETSTHDNKTATQRLSEEEDARPSTGTVALDQVNLPQNPSTVFLNIDTATQAKSESPPISPFDRDQLLHNRYRRLKILGRGGFGAAFLTDDTKLNRACVIKQLVTFGKSSREVSLYRANFEREAQLLVALNHPGHPNIPEIYDHFSEADSNYLVMKYIEGRNLQDVLEQSNNQLPWREAVRYAIDVCSALNYMHTHGDEPVMHRDVKPANILLGDDGRIWLVDFGLAKANPVTDAHDSTEETRAYGSVGYSPLEQWFGQARPSSDVYAVGATLHHLLTGVSPLDAYEGKSNILKIKELHGKFTPVRQIDSSLPKALEEIISRATDADPERRPTPLQLKEQLSALISSSQRALFTFKNGESAQTVPELVDLCDKNRREAEAYLYQGDFERWFLLINRNDLAAAATQAVKENAEQKEGLERFLHLILPNLFLRRLRKATVRVAILIAQFLIIAAIILIPLAICSSYVGGWFLQRSIGTVDWPFNTLSVEEDNVYTEEFLTEKLDGIAGAYLGNLHVDTSPPSRVNVSGVLWGLPMQMPITLTLQTGKPNFEVTSLNDYPLYMLGDNVTAGINSGVDEAFRQSPVDLTSLKVNDQAVVFRVTESDEPNRPPFATATPTPTPTPSPTPTPTPVPVTLVVVSNELDNDVTLEVTGDEWSQSLDLPAKDVQILEPPSGVYQYVVKYKAVNQIAAQGEQIWTLNKAYRLRIGRLDQQ